MINTPIRTAPLSAEERSTHKMFSGISLLPIVLVVALFFLWGIANNLNDVLIRQFIKSFELTRFKAGLVQSAFYLGYFLFAVPAALIMRKYGYKWGLVTGLALYGIGTLLFLPAAKIAQYNFFLFALFVIASGLAFLETGSNSFIAQLGDPITSEQRLNFAQAFNPLGSISGVLIGKIFIFSGVELSVAQVASMKAANTYDAYLHGETTRVIMPYLVLGAIVFLWAALMARTKFPHVGEQLDATGHEDRGRIADLLKYPHFLQAVLAQFLYVGAQVGTWSFFIQYVQDYTQQPEKTAANFLIGTLGAFALGRFAATYMMRYIAPGRLMGIYSLINVGLVGIAILFPGWIGLGALLVTSFFMSMMFPTIFALGVKELGPNTKVGGSVIIMAIIGGAVLPLLMGSAAELLHSMAQAMIVPGAAYLFLAYFAFVGSRVRNTRPVIAT